MSEDKFNPLEGYEPEDIETEDIKAVSLTEEQTKELVKGIEDSMKAAATVGEALSVLTKIGKLAMQMGLKSYLEGLR